MEANILDYKGAYDGDQHGISITPVIPAKPAIKYSRDGVNWSDEPIMEKNVGEYEVFCRLQYERYYPLEGSAKIIITPRSGASVTFVEGPYIKNYGDEDPNFKVSFTDLVTGDTPEINKDYTISRDKGENVLPANGSYNVYFN